MSYYRLARELKKTVAEILEMSEDEFTGWVAFLNLESRHG